MSIISHLPILFDLDGTLTDPKLGIIKSVQYALILGILLGAISMEHVRKRPRLLPVC